MTIESDHDFVCRLWREHGLADSNGNADIKRLLNMHSFIAAMEARSRLAAEQRSFSIDSARLFVASYKKNAAYHKAQRKIWQRRCRAVFRQAHGRAPTVTELDALVAKDWKPFNGAAE